jgi:hypothetical protein
VTWRTEACIALDETQGVSVEQLRPSDVGVLLAVLIVQCWRLSCSATLLRELPILACVEIISLASAICSALNFLVPMHHTISCRTSSRICCYVGRSRIHQAAAGAGARGL